MPLLFWPVLSLYFAICVLALHPQIGGLYLVKTYFCASKNLSTQLFKHFSSPFSNLSEANWELTHFLKHLKSIAFFKIVKGTWRRDFGSLQLVSLWKFFRTYSFAGSLLIVLVQQIRISLFESFRQDSSDLEALIVGLSSMTCWENESRWFLL